MAYNLKSTPICFVFPMYSKACILACLCVMGLVPSAEVSAGTITRTFTFTASNFAGPAPVDPLAGSFTITWDTDVDTTDTTTGILLNALNVPLGSAIGFAYVAATDEMAIGGMDGGVGLLSSWVDDLSIVFTQASGTPVGGEVYYSVAGSPSIFHASLDTLDIPEPASMLLLGGALLGLGVVGRRRTS